MRGLHKVCYTVCMVCVALAALAGIGIIWLGGENEVAWRSLGTIFIVFMASLMFVFVDRQFTGWIETLQEKRGPRHTATTVVQYAPPQQNPPGV